MRGIEAVRAVSQSVAVSPPVAVSQSVKIRAFQCRADSDQRSDPLGYAIREGIVGVGDR